MHRHRLALAALGLTACASLAAPPPLAPLPFVSGLANPLEIVSAADGTPRLFVLEKAGRVRVVRGGQLLATPFLDLRPANGGPVLASGEGGLLGLAFHPDYASNGRFYVLYTRALAGNAAGLEIVVARYTRSAQDADRADAASGRVVITVAHPSETNHNGGKIAFGPDRYLYVSVGDGGGGGDPFATGQSLADLRGKILRLDVDGGAPYAIPPSNPFASAGPSARPEIWAYGLRNPWRFSFDRATGDLFIGDVGQGAWEEIDFEPRGSAGGRNYGWSVFEGSHCFNPSSGCALAGHVPPILEYGHNSTDGGFSVTGGYRYRGSGLPALAGHYVYGDFVSGRVWAAAPDGNGTWVPTQVATLGGLSAFGEDEAGELYAANYNAGTVVRLTPAADLAVTQSPAPATGGTGKDVVFAVTVTNVGAGAAAGVTLTDTLPAGAAFVWASPGCAVAAGTATCALGTIAGGAARQVVLVVRPAAAGTITNAASVASAGLDANPGNNAASATVDVNVSPAGVPVLRYRLFSPVTLEHLYTTSLNEYDTLGALAGTWVKEGTVGRVLDNPGSWNGTGATPYYRLYNASNLQHHWTTDPNEYYTLALFPQYAAEGVDGYLMPTQAPGTIALYRLLYPFTVPVAGLHHWTIDLVEYEALVASFGWVGEGGSGFVIP